MLLKSFFPAPSLISALINKHKRASFIALAFGLLLGLGSWRWATNSAAAFQCVSLTTLGSASTQNFDTLSNTAGSTTNNLTITGWFLTESGGGARDNEQYAVDTGASTTGDMYSYGAAGATDRALGQLRSGTLIPLFGACYTNNTGSTITSLAIAYTGEEWRLGTAGRTDQLNFEYSLNATDLVTGTWTNIAALNFVTPDTVTTGAKNGNAAADRTALSSTITGLNIANGATFWIRWNDTDATGADDGLAVDDFSITPNSTVAQPNLSINDVTLNEGNAGTTAFTFTASLSAPAGPGGVTFDIGTVDGTATAPGDYTAKSLTGQTIPAGSSTYTFTVLVNGDTIPETNETFVVNITNVTGANGADLSGQGTIINDDAAPNLMINDVSLNEGNAGTTTFTFTVSLSAPAPAGGVTFDIATADGTAASPTDYTAKPSTSQSIPAGSSTYTFDVVVNGDTTPETDETFFVNLSNISNAIGVDTQGLGTIVNDDITKIHDVQGNGAATPIAGSTVTVEGVVIGNYQGSNKLSGFFLQEEDADVDADPTTSEGLFIFCNTCPTAVAEGQRVKATGVVSEFNNMTEITASTAGAVLITNASNNLALVTSATIDLPIAGDINAFYEAREGMRVTFVDALSVAEYNDLSRYGTIELYEGGRPSQFAEISAPSVPGYAAHLDTLSRRRIILDDENNIQNFFLTTSSPAGPADGLQNVFHPRTNGGFSVGTQGTDFFRGGDLVNGLTGVLHWSFSGTGSVDAWRIRPTASFPVTFTVANPRPATPPAVDGAIKVAGMNLLNYFTTIDTTSSNSTGPCGPSGNQDCRGADSVAELNRQRERASIVICSINADVYGFMELENTTPSDTITDLLGAVNTRCGGSKPYAFVNTGGTLGTDAIRVQLIYRTGVVSPVGSPLVDLNSVHNRPPTAQTFDVVNASNPAFGQRFTVIANHAKSKGSCPSSGADADQGDGQACFNATRIAQANRLLTWINSTVIPAAGDPDVLMLGDFNAYAREDSITTIVAGGFTDLETALLGPNAYSYLFDGQLGHLDYAFASTSLMPQVTSVAAWHINADESDLFDYNDEIKDAGESSFEEKPDGSALVPPRVVFQPASPYRASDHDPVLVGLFRIADLAINASDSPDPVIAGNTLTYTVTVTNNGPDAASSASWSDTLPAGTTFVSLPTVAGWSCVTPAVGVGGTVSCSNLSFAAAGSSVFTLTVAVAPTIAAGTVLNNTASVTSATGDGNSMNNDASTTTTVAASADLSLTKLATPDPVIAGNNLTYTITATNAGPSNAATVSLSDTLPAGTTFVSLAAPGGWSCTTPAIGASGTVSCTASTLAIGNAVFTLVVNARTTGVLSNTATLLSVTTDPNTGNESATATTASNCQTLTVTNPVTTTGTAGTAFSQTFTQTSGIGTTTFSTASTLPTGLTLSPAGVLGGTPTQTGTFPITVKATDSNGCMGTGATYTLVIGCQTITVTNPATATGTLGTAFSQTFTQAGGIGATTFSTASTLPTGMTLSTTGVLGGTPTQIGTFPITVKATDSNGCMGTAATYTLVIGCQTITVMNPATATGTAGTSFNQTFTQTGGINPMTFGTSNPLPAKLTLSAGFSTASTLPTGLTLSPAGVLSGTPTQTGTFPITVKVTDSNGCMGTGATYTLVIGCQTITVTNPATVTGTATTLFNQTFTQTGGIGTTTFSTASTLPTGLTLSPAGVLGGTPTQTGTFPITVKATDNNGCMGTGATYTLVISPSPAFPPNPTMSLFDPLACAGPGDLVVGSFGVTNTSLISQTGTVTVTLPSAVIGMPGTCTTNVGTCVVTATTVIWTGTLTANQAMTASYQAQLANNVVQGSTACATTTAVFGNNTGTVQACLTINCAQAGPGLLPGGQNSISDQKPGSVLIYPIFSSSASNANSQNTRIAITNTNMSRTSYVHLFFVDGSSCSVADSYICLTPNQTAAILASDVDPGTTGYIVAVAVNAAGCPIDFNFLIGDEYVKLASGHASNLSAESVAAIAGGLTACNPLTDNNAVLAFNNANYNALPRVLASSNLPSRQDGNDTYVVIDRIGGNLSTAGSTMGGLFGLLYDDAESAYSFSLPSSACQSAGSISNDRPRTVPRLDTVIPSGRTGWFKVWGASDIGIIGAQINRNTNAGSNASAFNHGHNLHKLTLTTTSSITIPVFPPSC